MKPVTASPTQEALAGLVERVTYHNAEKGFCVLRTKARVVVLHGHLHADLDHAAGGYMEEIRRIVG